MFIHAEQQQLQRYPAKSLPLSVHLTRLIRGMFSFPSVILNTIRSTDRNNRQQFKEFSALCSSVSDRLSALQRETSRL